MPKRVARIDAVFSIEGRGTVVALEKEDSWSLDPTEAIHHRERIQIRTPGGEHILTFIENIEFIKRGRGQGSVALGLPQTVKPDHIPAGSELWLERDGTEPVLEP